MDFFSQAGKMAIGSRVRLLADKITEDASAIYEIYGADLKPKWFPVFYVLSQSNDMSVMTIAEAIGHSHASVSKILKEMTKAGLVKEKVDSRDRRRTSLSLSAKGLKISRKIETQYRDVSDAIEELSNSSQHDLWAALEEWAELLKNKSLLQRVLEKRRDREASGVEIEDYQPKYRKAFAELNREWIEKYFKIEQPDIEALENPKHYILDKGGHILVATSGGRAVGVCGLIPMKDGVYELAKMAVAPQERGKNVGWKLGRAAIEKARELKAKSIFLESNTILKPAIKLYEKLGFKEIKGRPSPYERCNIQMELIF